MSIYNQVQADMTAALKARDTERRAALSFLFSELKAVAVDKGDRDNLPDADAIGVLQKQRKSRDETLQSAIDGNREELAAKTRYEIALIAEYLPEAPDEAKVEETVRAVIADLGASSVRDMGKVMAEVPNRLAGVDKATLSGVVKRLLAG
ncbi:MAG: GatB/YqeY domain-containing protein [Armatimonadetes bacterium]|nr:GatB/YqeY domain-containing protein [Armatimonadota bacterium]